jgi:hypothetical protein
MLIPNTSTSVDVVVFAAEQDAYIEPASLCHHGKKRVRVNMLYFM